MKYFVPERKMVSKKKQNQAQRKATAKRRRGPTVVAVVAVVAVVVVVVVVVFVALAEQPFNEPLPPQPPAPPHPTSTLFGSSFVFYSTLKTDRKRLKRTKTKDFFTEFYRVLPSLIGLDFTRFLGVLRGYKGLRGVLGALICICCMQMRLQL